MNSNCRENCNFKLIDKEKKIFKCFFCRNIHNCGENCTDTIYNKDFTKICKITGLCFHQKYCDSKFISPNYKEDDYIYIHKIKKNQQIKNSILKINLIENIFGELNYYKNFSTQVKINFHNDILKLWNEFVSISEEKKIYIKRCNKRIFLVAVMFSITKGLKNSPSSIIIHAHPFILIDKKFFNKKRKYKYFNVSDIRLGQILLQEIFSKIIVKNPLKIF